MNNVVTLKDNIVTTFEEQVETLGAGVPQENLSHQKVEIPS